MPVLIAPTYADIDRLVRIERSFPPSQRYSADDFRRCLRRRRRFETLILTGAGVDFGYAIVDLQGGSDADAVFLESLCVAPGLTGQGHGSRLMGLVETRYRQAVELQARPSAAAFYERVGYIEVPAKRQGHRRFYRKEGRLWQGSLAEDTCRG